MNYTTIEAVIDHGHVTVTEPDRLPERGRGLLIVLPGEGTAEPEKREPLRVQLPLIHGDGQHRINPSPEELDASLWD